MERHVFPELRRYVEGRVLPAMSSIPEDRKRTLDRLATFISKRRAEGASADLVFICTHNSRRSHLGQLWAAVAAWSHAQDHVRTHSGGTEATAFDPRAVAAVERAGLRVQRPKGEDTVHLVSFTSEREPERCWSKVYDDPANPMQEFCAVMTCSEADRNCPLVIGALERISLPYPDPKEADGTAEETGRYDESCLRIAAELFHVMQHASR